MYFFTHQSPEEEVRVIVSAVASALAHAHSLGVFHRDVKPNNVLVDASGLAYLADWGLAAYRPGGAAVRGVAGTRGFLPIEAFTGVVYGLEYQDVFGLG